MTLFKYKALYMCKVLRELQSKPLLFLRSITCSLWFHPYFVVLGIISLFLLLIIEANPSNSKFLRLGESKTFCSEVSSIAHWLTLRYLREASAEDYVTKLSCSGLDRQPLKSSLERRNRLLSVMLAI